ncbi:acyl carrier protein [Vibrio coralliilyticus OCN008]|uniref:acyl carrier protein n=1 Tax=Vibrio coralliilyticus TaxID=190893 RepID=UPI000391049F|nr:acyl carrier protein [Vibrio coralliilyticus]ERB65626.1 hypothetical protein N779_09300 [Vibrio coralliilyticus OCN008]QIJ86784.1 acyl carrier protein [Vibrio coralliilyticus OCN008]
MNYRTEIKNYICGELAPDIAADTLPEDCDLIMTGVIDSLSLVRLVAWLEEEFEIPTGDIEIAPEDFSSIERIEQFIHEHAPLTA